MWSPTHVQVTVCRARNLKVKGKNGTNDAYVVIKMGKEKFQTSVRERAKEPEWWEQCDFPLKDNRSIVKLKVFHRNLVGRDDFLGQIELDVEQFKVHERAKRKWYSLMNKPGSKAPEQYRGEVEIILSFNVKSLSSSQLVLNKPLHSTLTPTASGSGLKPLSAVRGFGDKVASKVHIGSRSSRSDVKKDVNIGNPNKMRTSVILPMSYNQSPLPLKDEGDVADSERKAAKSDVESAPEANSENEDVQDSTDATWVAAAPAKKTKNVQLTHTGKFLSQSTFNISTSPPLFCGEKEGRASDTNITSVNEESDAVAVDDHADSHSTTVIDTDCEDAAAAAAAKVSTPSLSTECYEVSVISEGDNQFVNTRSDDYKSADEADDGVTPVSKLSASISCDDDRSLSRHSMSSNGDKSTDPQGIGTSHQWQGGMSGDDLDPSINTSGNLVVGIQTRNDDDDDMHEESRSTDDHRQTSASETSCDYGELAIGDDSTFERDFSRLSSVQNDSGWNAASAGDNVTVESLRVTTPEPVTSDQDQEQDKMASVTMEAVDEFQQDSLDACKEDDAKELRNFQTESATEPRKTAVSGDVIQKRSMCEEHDVTVKCSPKLHFSATNEPLIPSPDGVTSVTSRIVSPFHAQLSANIAREYSSYSSYSKEELIQLVIKQRIQLREREAHVADLERYIDNLLAKVIDQQPMLLCSPCDIGTPIIGLPLSSAVAASASSTPSTASGIPRLAATVRSHPTSDASCATASRQMSPFIRSAATTKQNQKTTTTTAAAAAAPGGQKVFPPNPFVTLQKILK